MTRPRTTAAGRRRSTDTRERVLDVAERLVQLRGFNAFSYADVAAELGITKASLHYHFPGKAELGEALIVRYTQRFSEALAAIDADQADAPAKLNAYLGLYLEVLRGRRMCLCGMLAAEYQTLPKPMRAAVVAFFDTNEAWLARILEHGRRDATLHFEGAANDPARMIISALQGAMLIARPHADLTGFQTTAARLIASIAGTRT
jgi:TetR/AcrR family transcriptional regulator, transcriptional repressor for nem operon